MAPSLSRRAVVSLLAVSLVLFFVLVVVPDAIDFFSGNVTANVEMRVYYQGSWNGTYSYGGLCGGSSSGGHTVSIHGDGGVSQTSLSFRGNWNTGLGFQFRIHKLDNSTNVLRVVVSESEPRWSYDNSTSAPMGTLDSGVCEIA